MLDTIGPGNWTREELNSATCSLLSRGAWLKPAVFRVETDEGPVLVKDCASNLFIFRPLARWLLGRERKALQKVAGIEGVPKLLAQPDANAFVCSWLLGAPLAREGFQRNPQGVAGQLRNLVSAIHERGVFHLDLRQSQHLLLSESGQLSCVDFGAAWVPGILGKLFLSKVFASVDENAVVKWLARFSPELLTAAEAKRLIRGKFWRKMWFVSPHTDRGEVAAARRRLEELGEKL